MTVFERMLRALVREELARLSEAAVTAAAAASAGLALMKPSDGTGAYVLYDSKKVVAALAGMSGETSWRLATALEDKKAVVGMLHVDFERGCRDSRAVMSSAAERGYGPLMYDVALADGPLAPMRGSVSLSAERVWRHYFEQRDDVTHKPLSGCRMHPKARPWLNFKYEVLSPMNASSLTRAHDGVVKQLSGDFVRSDVEAALRGAGDRYFDARYTEA
jgi:hypothetical protein